MHPFLTEWARFKRRRPPFYLDGDEILLDDGVAGRWTVILGSWNEYIRRPDFGTPYDRRLHLGLLPIPFLGSPASASVVILMLNPGLAETDYYGEYEVSAYRRVARRNLAHGQSSQSNHMLDPRFSWHGGFKYWHGKLQGLVGAFGETHNLSRAQSLGVFAREISVLEFMPYHSAVSGFPRRLMEQLRSVQLARSFAKDVLEPRSQDGKTTLIVTRSAKDWDLSEGDNVIVYSVNEARAAHLSPKSRGGTAILRQINRAL